jgi:drug/metabolite transporter (DMT)-like permease
MQASDLYRLILLAAIWGGSYPLIRIAAPELGALGTAWTRMLSAGLLLCVYARQTGVDLGIKRWWKHYLFAGALSTAVPFSLISEGMKVLPASYGAVLNALSPLFAALFAAMLLRDPLTWRRLSGIAIGIAGVVVLVQLGPQKASVEVVLASLACVLATVSYGYFAVHARKHLSDASGIGVAAGTLLLPSFPLGLIALPTLPSSIPSINALLAMLVLSVVCSGVAYVLYFRLIRDVGPARAISVTFLIPVFGTLFGVLFQGERLTLSLLAGAALIACGMALVLYRPAARQA